MAYNLSELESRINAGDIEAINAAISGEVFNEEVADAQASEQGGEDHPEQQAGEQPPQQDAPDANQSSEYVEIERERAEERRKHREEVESMNRAMEELRAAAKEKEERLLRIETEKVLQQVGKEERIDLLDESSEDPDLLSNHSKNTRKLVESLKEKISKSESEALSKILERIERIEQSDKQRELEIAQKNSEREIEDARDKIFNEVDGFISKNQEFKIPKSTKEMFKDYTKFRGELKAYLGTNDDNEVNRSIYAVAYGETARDRALKEVIEKSGSVKIPEGINKYMDLVQISDRQSGYQMNRVTGELEPIVDSQGVPVRYRNIEEAHMVSRHYGDISAARKEAALSVQHKIDVRSASATTLPDRVIVDVDKANKRNMSIEELLKIPAADIRKNPELKKRFDEAMVELEMDKF